MISPILKLLAPIATACTVLYVLGVYIYTAIYKGPEGIEVLMSKLYLYAVVTILGAIGIVSLGLLFAGLWLWVSHAYKGFRKAADIRRRRNRYK